MGMTQKAIILAAGRGTRMGGLCEDLPKPMLEIGGRPILAHTIDQLLKSGIQEIGINTHYKHEIIHDFLDTHYSDGVIHTVYEETLSGTAGALRNFKDFLTDQDQFIVIAGDILTEYPYQELLKFHQQTAAEASFVYHERRKSNSLVEIDDHSKVINFLERPREDVFRENQMHKVNSSIYCFNRDVIDTIPNSGVVDIPHDIFPYYLKKQKLYATPLIGKRWAIDTPERLIEARKDFP